MGFIGPALPWIVKGGAALGGMLLGRKAQSSAMKRSPEEQQALAGAQGAAAGLSQQGTSLIGQGTGYLGQAGNYYSTLLGGNRAAMAQATAGPRAAITDVYRGAERGLERSNVRGAARDVATGDLGRQRASQLSSLVTGVQPGAAAGLAGMGGQFLGTGGQLAQAGGSLYGNLLGQGFQNRVYGREEGGKAGKGIGGFLFDLLSSIPAFGGGKKPPLSTLPVPKIPPVQAPSVGMTRPDYNWPTQ